MQQAMLNREIKLYIIYILFYCFLIACNNKEKEIKKNSELYYKYSTQAATEHIYKQIYGMAKDSINVWIQNKLQTVKYENANNWQIDTLICFNKDIDKCVMALAVSDTLYKQSPSDGITFFYGVKIRENWYFFKGAFIVIPRENYQKNRYPPLSFEKLHEIAMQEVYSGYLVKDTKGNWQINDKFFDYFNGMLTDTKRSDSLYRHITYKTEEQLWDSIAVYIVRSTWNRKN